MKKQELEGREDGQRRKREVQRNRDLCELRCVLVPKTFRNIFKDFLEEKCGNFSNLESFVSLSAWDLWRV